MLRHLSIRDFVLIDTLELEFEAGFGTLTGETGAGKSILIDALSFALGERADAASIRAGCAKAEVSAGFHVDNLPPLAEWLEERDIDHQPGDELLLRRSLDANGRSRAYINGTPVNAQQLREAAEYLLDIHGQHAHQSLLRSGAQRALFDTHAGLAALAAEVSAAWRDWRAASSSLADAETNAAGREEERQRLQWTVSDIAALEFSIEGWQALEQEHERLANAGALIDGAQSALAALAEDETAGEGGGACLTRLDSVCAQLEPLLACDPALSEIVELARSARAELSEAVLALRRYRDRADPDPERLAEVERRIRAVVDCARKYRVAPQELPQILAATQARLAELSAAIDLEALARRVEEAQEAYRAQAKKLSAKRRKAAEALSAEVSALMRQLALGSGRFEAALVPLEEGNAFGLEQIEFRIAGADEAPARPLAKVASGGELSRISLAIQVVTSRAAEVPTLIFDEVDVGIGGGVAEVVGRLLHELGRNRQVLCVTHLPQVAARADWQWQVSKERVDGAFRSRLSRLDAAERVEEIARMSGGVEITEATRRHAREMLKG
ncbi:MAG: DNA repair protein RecN [Betaproteobacteria bacterium]|nr:DNA repair protein RecN [Betaproteobacteria bacterium]